MHPALKFGLGVVAGAVTLLLLDHARTPTRVRIEGPSTIEAHACGHGGGGSAVSVPSNIADVTYATKLTVGSGDRLTVWPSTGAPVVFAQHPVAAQYYHLGRMLVVEIGEEKGGRQFHYFVEPIRWETSPLT